MSVLTHPLQLGASLYMPATRNNLADIICHNKITNLRSLVLCLEDAICTDELEVAMVNIAKLCADLQSTKKHCYVFIRPRHKDNLAALLALPHISAIDGFVLPKFDTTTLQSYADLLDGCPLKVMPTLETADIFDPFCQRDIVAGLSRFTHILALRVGGNDLLNALGLRRPFVGTIYDTPLGALIGQLCGRFLSQGFALTAPVFEHYANKDDLKKELTLDINHGFCGKTVIHPSQIAIVHHAYKVSDSEYKQACAILDPKAQAVFASDGSMLEPATHARWAKRVTLRAQVFGIRTPTCI